MVPADALAASDGDPFLGRVVAGRFVVMRRLGAGSMGTVYRARQEAVARDVAVKILRSDRALDQLARQRFVREAKAMSLLVSPHTVTVFDFGEMAEPSSDDDLDGGNVSLFLAMELLDGEALGDRIKRLGRIAWPDALAIVRQALLSLGEAHDKGVIHRDLKPDNLFLAKAPNGGEIVKVLDFGIAKVATDKSPMVDALETQAGTVFGTPRYMSPEQAQGRALDARSDLYSLAVILYQMLVGRAPFVDEDAVVVMARHIKQKPVPPHEAAKDARIPPSVSRLVMRALSKDPADRPASALAFTEELEAAAREAVSSPASPSADASGSGAVVAVTLLGEGGLGEGGLGEAGPGEPHGVEPALSGPQAGDAGPMSRRAPVRPVEPPRRRPWTVAAVLGAALLVAAGATFLSARGSAVPPPARPTVGPSVRARAETVLQSLSARPPASAEGASAASASAASAAPSLPAAAVAPRPSVSPAPSRPAASAKPAAPPTGKKPKYTRFE